MLSRLSHRCLLWACSLKLLPALDRIEREKEQEQKDSYLKQCSQALTDELMAAVRAVTAHIATDLRAVLGMGASAGAASGLDFKSLSLKKLLSAPSLKSLKERISCFVNRFVLFYYMVCLIQHRYKLFCYSASRGCQRGVSIASLHNTNDSRLGRVAHPHTPPSVLPALPTSRIRGLYTHQRCRQHHHHYSCCSLHNSRPGGVSQQPSHSP